MRVGRTSDQRALATATDLLFTRDPTLGPVRLGVVDGPSGSGKSTFALQWATAVAARLDGPLRAVAARPDRMPGAEPAVVLFSTDHLATWTEPFGWWDRIETGLLQPLADGRPGRLRLNDWSSGRPLPGDEVEVPVPAVLILEGVSAARRALAGRATATVWVEVADRSTRLERAVARDGEPSRGFLQKWQDDEDRHFAVDLTRERADLVSLPS